MWKSYLRVEGTIWVLFLFSWDNYMFLSRLKEKVLTWKFDIAGLRAGLCASFFSRDLQIFPFRWNQRSWLGKLNYQVEETSLCACSLFLGCSNVSFSLKENVLTWDVDLWGWGHVFVCLFSSPKIFNHLSSLLEENVLILKPFLLEKQRVWFEEKSFTWEWLFFCLEMTSCLW